MFDALIWEGVSWRFEILGLLEKGCCKIQKMRQCCCNPGMYVFFAAESLKKIYLQKVAVSVSAIVVWGFKKNTFGTFTAIWYAMPWLSSPRPKWERGNLVPPPPQSLWTPFPMNRGLQDHLNWNFSQIQINQININSHIQISISPIPKNAPSGLSKYHCVHQAWRGGERQRQKIKKSKMDGWLDRWITPKDSSILFWLRKMISMKHCHLILILLIN